MPLCDNKKQIQKRFQHTHRAVRKTALAIDVNNRSISEHHHPLRARRKIYTAIITFSSSQP
jgi:hypothetical protein